MQRWTLFALSLPLVCAAPLAAAAQPQPRGEAKSGQGTIASGDEFMTKAAQDGRGEVELGKLASDKASAPAVRQFAERMVNDHGRANDELTQLAQQKGVTLPPARTDVREFDKQATNPKDPDVKAWAATTLLVSPRPSR